MKAILMREDGAEMVASMALSDGSPRNLPLIGAMVAEVTDDEVAALQAQGVTVFPDERLFIPPYPPRVRAAFLYPTDESKPETPGPMRQMEVSGVEELLELGYSGKGVCIGIADTGVDEDHPDLAGKLEEWADFVEPGNVEAKDPNGHGTAVAGISCGTGSCVPKFHGVAPRADFRMARVLDVDGGGYTSAIIEGMTWLADRGCKIINLSLGSTSVMYTPMSKAVDQLCSRGIVVCVAAGNDGPLGRITSPANAYGCVCVAACDQLGRRADFSSIGPATGKDEEDIPKPDVMAWGENVVVARSEHGKGEGIQVHNEYQAMDGTSFSSPFVAGAAALYLQAVGNLDKFKSCLTSTAIDSGDLTHEQEGSGRIDVHEAIADGMLVDEVPPCPDPDPAPPIDPPTPNPDPGGEFTPGCGTMLLVAMGALAIIVALFGHLLG